MDNKYKKKLKLGEQIFPDSMDDNFLNLIYV